MITKSTFFVIWFCTKSTSAHTFNINNSLWNSKPSNNVFPSVKKIFICQLHAHTCDPLFANWRTCICTSVFSLIVEAKHAQGEIELFLQRRQDPSSMRFFFAFLSRAKFPRNWRRMNWPFLPYLKVVLYCCFAVWDMRNLRGAWTYMALVIYNLLFSGLLSVLKWTRVIFSRCLSAIGVETS